jgi:phage protein U
MKIKQLIAVFFAVLGIFSLSACQLASEDATESAHDRLIGVFITYEYLDLFDFDSYLTDNISGFPGGDISEDANSEKYQDRLYATLKEKVLINEDTGEETVVEEYVFEGVEGFAYLAVKDGNNGHVNFHSDEAISDRNSRLYSGDDEDKIKLEGTIYSAPGNDGFITYYINPVYQGSDSSIYAMSGGGFSIDATQGKGHYTNMLEETTTVTENGTDKKSSTSIEISFVPMFPPEKIVLLQMDKDSTILSKNEYTPGEMPEMLTPKTGTDYIVAETYKSDNAGTVYVTREIYDQQDEYLYTFFFRDDNICIKTGTKLEWNG